MDHPFFSIITPTFNRASIILKSIQSVLNQTFENFELIIVDDGSSDNTKAMVSEIQDKRIRYVYQENAGVSYTRNTGAGESLGKFLIFLDSDDELTPDWLKQAHVLIQSSGTISCFCFATIFKIPGKAETVIRPRELGALYEHKKGLFLAGTFIISRDVFWKAGAYDPCLFFGENDELGQRICKVSDIVCSDVVSLISHRDARIEKNKKYKREVMAKTLEHYLEKYKDDLIRLDKDRLISMNNRLAVCYFVMNKDNLAVKLLVTNIRNYFNLKSFRILMRIKFFPGLYRKFLNKKGLI